MTRQHRQRELHRLLSQSDGHRRIIQIWRKTVPGPTMPQKPEVGVFFGQLIREILEKEFPVAKR